nr:bifunctional 3-(3-hydroxy-phenyl)propionate/3-hydroxycinnamic acid hydroxylase [uncultured Rhodopila sp.]
MQNESLFDVVQIGYGPVSQVLALMLARQGHRVAVVERWREPYVLPRAVCIDHEGARILHAIGVGEGLARVSRPAPRYQWFNADWEELLSIDWSAGSISGGPEVNFVHQPSLEAEIRTEVRRQPSVELNLGWDMVGFTDHGDHVEVQLREYEGSGTRTLRARYLVGADGANSLVRETLGIGRSDRGFQADWLVVDMKLNPGVTLDIPACGQYCKPERPTTIVPGGVQDGRICRRWEFMRLPHETREDLEGEANVWKLLEPWVTRDQAEMVRHAIYTFRSLIADTWRRGRVMIAGDAAHVMPPFMGQGMCAGIRDAWNLSWKLDAVLRGRADDTLLDTYTAERKPHVTAVIDASVYLGRIICIADHAEAAARDQAFKSGTAEPLPPFPHLTAGLLARNADETTRPMVGLLSPHGTVRLRTHEGRWDEVVGQGFTVVVRDADPAKLLRPDQLRALETIGGHAVCLTNGRGGERVVDVDGRFGDFLKAHGAAGMIVRPDFYVFGGVAASDDLPDLVDNLLAELAASGVHVSAVAQAA